MKILALKWRRLGDTVLWTSALDALFQKFPGAQIDIAFAAEYAPLFHADSRFQTQYLLKSDTAHLRSLINTWHEQQYDLVLAFHASSQTQRLARSAKGRRCLIHHHSRKPRLFGSDEPIVDLGKAMGATDRDVNVVRTLGWSGVAPPTRLVLAPSWIQSARKRWESLKKTADDSPVILSFGASRNSKRWPFERYVELIERLPSQALLLCEDSSALAPYRALLQRVQSRVAIACTPLLEEALGLLSIGRCYIGGDSGLKHAAIALGVPTISLFGPESVGEWHPYPLSKHPVLQKKVLCRDKDADNPEYAWCGAQTCPLGSHACLSLISADEVFEKLKEIGLE